MYIVNSKYIACKYSDLVEILADKEITVKSFVVDQFVLNEYNIKQLQEDINSLIKEREQEVDDWNRV